MKTSLLCTSCYGSVEIHSKIILNTYLFLYLFLYFFYQIYFYFYCFYFLYLMTVAKYYLNLQSGTPL